MSQLLSIKNLKISTNKNKIDIPLVNGIDISLNKGEILGIVGESGSGKSISMKALLNILPENVHASYDSYLYEGNDATNKVLPLSVIFQDPMTSLNPVRTIKYHMSEVIKRQDKSLSKDAINNEIIKYLELVGINNPTQRMNQYPFELSGGMMQRIMIAMALLAKPQVLIADEPTTALDVTIQAQILKLIKTLQKENNLSVILVTHDFGVVASMCDHVIVMKDGDIVERGTVKEIFTHPKQDYTKSLLRAADLNKEGQSYVKTTD